ncbi:MAG: prepilin-type N-terminal cleavage/methylation domain-containing protein [Massilia sp.]
MSTDTAVRRARGLTLIEMLMFIVIVGIALAGILQVLAFTTRHSADPLRRKQALMIAEGLLEEVELAGFTYCDPRSDNADSATKSAECTIREAFGQGGAEPIGPRPYDNINDYVPAANTPTAAFDANGVLSDANRNPLDVNGYTARLTITPEALGAGADAIGAGGTSADTDVLRIRVEVSYDDQVLVLDGYRTRYAPVTQ